MRLKYFLLILPILFWSGCEDKKAEVDCTALTTAVADATLAYSEALLSDPTGDHSALCTANVAAYQAGLDAGCDGFDQAGLDVMQAACDDAAGGGDGDCTDLAIAAADATLAYSEALLSDPTGDHSALCTANVAAYQAGLDAGCDGFDQAGLDVMQAACDDAAGGGEDECEQHSDCESNYCNADGECIECPYEYDCSGECGGGDDGYLCSDGSYECNEEDCPIVSESVSGTYNITSFSLHPGGDCSVDDGISGMCFPNFGVSEAECPTGDCNCSVVMDGVTTEDDCDAADGDWDENNQECEQDCDATTEEMLVASCSLISPPQVSLPQNIALLNMFH